MGATPMARAVVSAMIENLEDVYGAERGTPPPELVRAVRVDDARADTDVAELLIPRRLVAALGLRACRRDRPAPGQRYSPVRLTVLGRGCVVDVYETADTAPVVIGRIPLHAMDWVVDATTGRVIGNPEHGGEHIIEAY